MADVKLVGNYIRKSVNENQNLEITFEVVPWASKREIDDLKKGEYLLQIKDIRNKRSLNQNALLWELIGEIGEAQNGNRSGDMEIYCNCLESCGAKVEYIACSPAALEAVKKQFRACQEIGSRKTERGEMVILKVFIGSSKMDSKEMSKLIDYVMDYAEKCGVDTDYYARQFGDLK